MQFVIAILALFLYTAIYVVGIIIVGIVELVQYIQCREEKSRKTAEREAKRIAAEKRKTELRKVKTTNVISKKPEDVVKINRDDEQRLKVDVNNKHETIAPSDELHITSLAKEAPEHKYNTTLDSQNTNKVIEVTDYHIEDQSTSADISQHLDNTNTLLGDIVQALLEYLKEKEFRNEDITSETDDVMLEDNSALLCGIITALYLHKREQSLNEIQEIKKLHELSRLISCVKENAESKIREVINIVETLASARFPKTDFAHIEENNLIHSEKNTGNHINLKTKKVQEDAIRELRQSDPKHKTPNSNRENIPATELSLFNNVIYHVKLIGHEDARFQLVAMKAYEIISKFSESPDFFAEVIKNTESDNDFATEIIRYIVIQKGLGVSDTDLIKSIRNRYIGCQESSSSTSSNIFLAKPKNTTEPVYIETETSLGSRQLTAKSKIAHKHKAIQYANIIGGRLLDGYTNSNEVSFHEYIKKQCKTIAAQGDCSITTEEFEPHKNIIATYKKSKKKAKSRTVATNIITPKHRAAESKADIVLKILDKLTASRLPRYEIPSFPSFGDIVQREYKKTNPFDVYNDLVSSEYNPGALNDKRFSVLYQLILFISECVESGMSEEDTLSAMSSLRVVNKRDLNILRDREVRFKGLSKTERELVLDSEICNSRDMTNLYIDLIHQYKQRKQTVNLNDFITGILLKNYKESKAAWRLLKYIYLKSNKKTNNDILDNRWTILETYFIDETNHGIKGLNESYYSFENSFIQLRNDYDHCVGMTHYNFKRDNITTDMLNVHTLMKYLPKRFDSKGRICTLIKVTSNEADIFESFDKRKVGEHIYVLYPIPSFTTNDLYSLLLTVNRQKRKK